MLFFTAVFTYDAPSANTKSLVTSNNHTKLNVLSKSSFSAPVSTRSSWADGCYVRGKLGLEAADPGRSFIGKAALGHTTRFLHPERLPWKIKWFLKQAWKTSKQPSRYVFDVSSKKKILHNTAPSKEISLRQIIVFIIKKQTYNRM